LTDSADLTFFVLIIRLLQQRLVMVCSFADGTLELACSKCCNVWAWVTGRVDDEELV
jgi:hypothetical protein